MTMEIMELPTARLRCRLDCKTLKEGTVKELMDIMRREGFRKSYALSVRPTKIRELNNGNIDGWEIIDGRHRFEAAWRLNFETAPCIIETDDDLHAEKHMIEADLIRADLTPIDLAKRTSRLKTIHEQLYPETRRSNDGGGFKGNRHTGSLVSLENSEASFVSETSSKTGRGESTIRKDAHRGAHISDEAADKLRGTQLDKGEYLDKLKKIPMKDQTAIIERDLSKKKACISTRGRPRKKDSPTANGEQVAAWIVAHVDNNKIPMLINLMEGTSLKYIIESLRKMLAE